MYTPEFGDQVIVKYYRDGKWSEPIAMTDAKQDIVRCAVAGERTARPGCAYSANRQGRHDVYVADASSGRAGMEAKLTDELRHYLPTIMRNRLVIRPASAWPAQNLEFKYGTAAYVRSQPIATGRGMYGYGNSRKIGLYWDECRLLERRTSRRGRDGDIARGLRLRTQTATTTSPCAIPIMKRKCSVLAASSKFRGPPLGLLRPRGRLWIAYEEGPELWGKDYGALVADQGQPLYSSRSVRVVCLEDGKLFKPAAELPTSDVQAARPRRRRQQASAELREAAALRLSRRSASTARAASGSPTARSSAPATRTHPGSYWLTFARRLDGDHWTEPIEVHHSDGLLDSRPVLLPHKSGGLLIVHNTDGRYTTPDHIDNDIYLSYLDLPGEPVEPKLVPHEPGKKDDKLVARHEGRDAKR